MTLKFLKDWPISKNPEILFSQGSLNVQNAFTGNGGDFCIANGLYRLYADNDYRKELFFTPASSSDSIALGRKYKRGLHQSYVSDLFLLRISEAYLNIAEACAMLDDPSGASDWLNIFRRNRIEGWQDVSYDQNTVIEEVRKERRRELCFEGHRWFDLRRYAVCRKAPLRKAIERVFAVYDWDSKMKFMRGEVFRLEIDDPAYVFSIPKSVLEFDTDMPDNVRPMRRLTEVINANFD